MGKLERIFLYGLLAGILINALTDSTIAGLIAAGIVDVILYITLPEKK